MNDEHKSSFDKKNSLRMHVDYMLKNNAEVECLAFDDGYIETAGWHRAIRMPKSFLDITYEHYKSATGYLSAFKNYFVMKFKGRNSIKPFNEKM
eukprot:1093335-Ditylum_brightwellii.AAC.1